ncbi:MAG: RluA family pseudouridine synthase [Acidimicrobiia bacterium]|nr:RluA family pseudouridine synthase [Acidimicrobiia bacterium]
MTAVDRAVPVDLDGERADRILAVLGEISRADARALVTAGDATFDGVAVKPADRIAAGTRLVSPLPVPEAPLEPEPVPFGVVHEDDHLAVVDKPAGITVHPGAGRRTGTLAAGILHRWPRVRGVGEEGRWGLVHRLDRDTSGLLLVALTVETHADLQAMLRRREVTRVYLARVRGRLDAATGTIDAPIGRDPRSPTRFRVDRGGRPARTHYEVLSDDGDGSLLRVTLETGRTHQIRVHLRSIGHPVLGDPVYGRSDEAPRLWLHAARLAFTHPVTGADVDVESPLPADLAGDGA